MPISRKGQCNLTQSGIPSVDKWIPEQAGAAVARQSDLNQTPR